MNAYDAVQAARRASGNNQEPASPPGACAAHGCPCSGSLDVGNTGRFFCSWHAWATPDRWPAITDALHAHRWLIDFIGELHEMQGGRLGSWVQRAREFWANDERCAPTEAEARRWSLYCWRLREELAWRIGVRQERPEPRDPQGSDAKASASRVFEDAQAGVNVPEAAITQALRATGDLPPSDEDEAIWAAQARDAERERLSADPRFAAWASRT